MTFRVPDDLFPYLRSDHAGETGAVELYRGLIRNGRDPLVSDFARRHLAAEEKHLTGFGELLGAQKPTLLLSLWRIGGRASAGLFSFMGRRVALTGIAAIEEGVVRHFRKQVAMLSGREEYGALVALFEEYVSDEALHRDEAERARGPAGPVLAVFAFLVRTAGAAFAAITRRL